jgi:hypothetical protein
VLGQCQYSFRAVSVQCQHSVRTVLRQCQYSVSTVSAECQYIVGEASAQCQCAGPDDVIASPKEVIGEEVRPMDHVGA